MTKYQLAFTHSRLAFINSFAFALQFAFACQFTTYFVSYFPPALAISNFLAFTFLFTLTEFFCLLVQFYLLQQIQLANLLLSSVFFLKNVGILFLSCHRVLCFARLFFTYWGSLTLLVCIYLLQQVSFPCKVTHCISFLSVCKLSLTSQLFLYICLLVYHLLCQISLASSLTTQFNFTILLTFTEVFYLLGLVYFVYKVRLAFTFWFTFNFPLVG